MCYYQGVIRVSIIRVIIRMNINTHEREMPVTLTRRITPSRSLLVLSGLLGLLGLLGLFGLPYAVLDHVPTLGGRLGERDSTTG